MSGYDPAFPRPKRPMIPVEIRKFGDDYARGFRAGQESMREAATKLAQDIADQLQTSADYHRMQMRLNVAMVGERIVFDWREIAQRIRALPIIEREGE